MVEAGTAFPGGLFTSFLPILSDLACEGAGLAFDDGCRRRFLYDLLLSYALL